MKNFSTDIDGKLIQGKVAVSETGVWVHLDGETFFVESAAKRARHVAGGAAAGTPGDILAPMPGKIIKLMVRKGDAVEKGQVVIVMEAMKMEYTLKAQAAGKIGEISCVNGDQVALGQRLVKMDV